MRKQMEGQLSIFDIHLAGRDRKPCEYSFQRFIGQRVMWGYYMTDKKPGNIIEIEPYYTIIRTDNGEILVGTPQSVKPMEV